METYYIITSNTCEIVEIGEYESLCLAEIDAETCEHYANGQAFIVCTKEQLSTYRNQINSILSKP